VLAGGPLRGFIAQIPPAGQGQLGELHLAGGLDYREVSGVAAGTTVVLRSAVMMRVQLQIGGRLDREREKNQDH
jgi:hypothetical protein